MCVALWLFLFTRLLLPLRSVALLPALPDVFLRVPREVKKSNPLCDFRLGTVATSDHETPLTVSLLDYHRTPAAWSPNELWSETWHPVSETLVLIHLTTKFSEVVYVHGWPGLSLQAIHGWRENPIGKQEGGDVPLYIKMGARAASSRPSTDGPLVVRG